ncbi:TPA: glycosyltransferase, partial [Bacillus luti]|nr:glycosyltransferase [Bacillus luti]
MKKKILFIINNLNCGGAEKALISLLENMNYSMYSVDLFLFKHEGVFFNKIPKQVNLLEEQLEYQYFDMPIKKAIVECIKSRRIDVAVARICAGYVFKSEKNGARCEQRVWKYLSKSLKCLDT